MSRFSNRIISSPGIYEVLSYEASLELFDINGIDAKFQKRERVRYLQDHVLAYHDQAWGEGEILVDFQCTPGIPVDVFHRDNKTMVLISLREERQTGDVDDFEIRWNMQSAFIFAQESWATHIKHKTKNLALRVVFPQFRPPGQVSVAANNSGRLADANSISKLQLPDGRWQVTWREPRPVQFETYILTWHW